MAAKKPERTPKGPALASTDAELDRVSRITPDDLRDAQETAKRHSRNSELSALLNADEQT